jgi:hypothetical protein
MTALSLFYSSIASAVLSTANQCWIVHGTDNTNVTQTYTKLGTATGWGEVFSQGTANAWAAAGSIGSPSGNGLFLDSAILSLNGQTIASGNWSATWRLAAGHTDGTLIGTFTADLRVRAYKYNSGTYTQIVDLSLTGQTINNTTTTFNLPATSASAVSFGSNDFLYLDFWGNVTANAGGDAVLQWRFNRLSNANVVHTGDSNASMTTPGYSATASAARVAVIGGDMQAGHFLIAGSSL